MAAAGQYKGAVDGVAQGLISALQREMPGVRTLEDVAKLSPDQKARFAELDRCYRQVKGEGEQLQVQIEAAKKEHYQDAFRRYAQAEERLVEQAIPELRPNADPAARRELQRASLEALTSAGFTPAELHSAWNEGAPVNLRDHRAQVLIAAAAKYYRMQARASKQEFTAHREKPPRVQKPGVRGRVDARIDHEISQLEAKRELSIHDGVALLRARRAARG